MNEESIAKIKRDLIFSEGLNIPTSNDFYNKKNR